MLQGIKRASLACGAAACALATAGGAALAQDLPDRDTKSYPGVNCVEVVDTTPEISYSYGGGAINDATFFNYWLCPAVRDREFRSHYEWSAIAKRDSLMRRGASSEMPVWSIQLFYANARATQSFRSTRSVPREEGTHEVGATLVPQEPLAGGFLTLRSDVAPGGEIISYHLNEHE